MTMKNVQPKLAIKKQTIAKLDAQAMNYIIGGEIPKSEVCRTISSHTR